VDVTFSAFCRSMTELIANVYNYLRNRNRRSESTKKKAA
jgi:hypothetical protein